MGGISSAIGDATGQGGKGGFGAPQQSGGQPQMGFGFNPNTDMPFSGQQPIDGIASSYNPAADLNKGLNFGGMAFGSGLNSAFGGLPGVMPLVNTAGQVANTALGGMANGIQGNQPANAELGAGAQTMLNSLNDMLIRPGLFSGNGQQPMPTSGMGGGKSNFGPQYDPSMGGNQKLWDQYNSERRADDMLMYVKQPGQQYGGGYQNWLKTMQNRQYDPMQNSSLNWQKSDQYNAYLNDPAYKAVNWGQPEGYKPVSYFDDPVQWQKNQEMMKAYEEPLRKQNQINQDTEMRYRNQWIEQQRSNPNAPKTMYDYYGGFNPAQPQGPQIGFGPAPIEQNPMQPAPQPVNRFAPPNAPGVRQQPRTAPRAGIPVQSARTLRPTTRTRLR